MPDPLLIFKSVNPFGLSEAGVSAWVDIDGDGDLDAFVGSYTGDTLFLRNTGTASNPVFAAAITNPFGLSAVVYSAKPTFVDIDGDGDFDAFVGSFYGNTLFFRNAGTASNPVFAAAVTNPFGLSDVGFLANPTFTDIDGDGDFDAFTGNSFGDMLFFRNAGTVRNPVFAAAVTNPFGLSTVGMSADPTFIDIDSDGDLDAFVGNMNGNTVFFRNTRTANSPAFTAGSINPLGLSDVGTNAIPTFVDIDSDGDLDALVGGNEGTVLFRNENSGILRKSTAGNDILTGTVSNNDTVTFASASAAVTVSLIITTQQNTMGAGLDTLTAIENLVGSNFDDSLQGDAKSNLLDGGEGNDLLNGVGGADIMLGGSGNDVYTVNHTEDIVIEFFANGALDRVNSSINYTLPLYVENLTLIGTLAINGIGNDFNNSLSGNVANNQLIGGGGNDILDGRAGMNSLIGGQGNDIFRFTTVVHTDTITDYNVANDTIQLENAVFTALTTIGPLATGQFRIGTQALDANDFIVYNNVTGQLLYDGDGSGAGAAVQIAMVSSGLAMTPADIVVI